MNDDNKRPADRPDVALSQTRLVKPRWGMKGDFASGMRTLPIVMEGPDYARGARTLPMVAEGPDYARGARTQPMPVEGPDYARGIRTVKVQSNDESG
jgi:hypothetical protein